jgi:predicted ester cyclase
MSAFPDGRVEITNVIADDRQAVVEYTGQGTMTGAMSTGGGDIPPTGRRMQMKLCDFMEIEDGKVIRYRSYFDAAFMMQQLGLTSEPAAPQG